MMQAELRACDMAANTAGNNGAGEETPRRPPSPRRLDSGLTAPQVRSSLALFSWNAGFRSIFETICGGTTFVFVAFACAFGFEKEQMGWVTLATSIACVLQIASLPFISMLGSSRKVALTAAFVEPCLVIIAVLVVPFLGAQARVPVFMAAVFLASAFVNMSRPITDEWLASTIPAELRGRYLGRRLQIVSGATIISTLVAGQLVERLGSSNVHGLSLILAGGGVCGVLAVVALKGAATPASTSAANVKWGDFASVWRGDSFRRCLIFMAVYNIPFFFACPYYQVFNLDVARMPADMIALMHTGYYLVKLITLPRLGKVADRLGARRTMAISAVIYTLFFAVFPLCGHGRYWPLMIAWAVVALADGAYSLAYQSAFYAAIPASAGRPAYFAVNNIVTMALFAAGASVAVPVLRLLRGVSFTAGPFVAGNFHILYGMCAVLMAPGVWFSRLLPEDRHTEFRQSSVVVRR